MLNRAKKVLTIEAQAINQMARRLGHDFQAAVELIAKCSGRVIVCGMGKSGIVARKIAATLSSTGTPGIFLHSAEAVHGDLGKVMSKDIVIIISQSGEAQESIRLLPLVRKIGAKIIVMTGNPKSTLGSHGDAVLNVAVKSEGCPLGLAPMASTTVTMALGDALAACLIDRKKFKKEDFALYHPGGSLGRRLLLKAEDIMRRESFFAKVLGAAKVKDVLWKITKARCGCACVVDGRGKLLGIFTDGDLRRHLEADHAVLLKKVSEVMTKNPASIQKEKLAAQAFDVLKTKKIDELPVVDRWGRVVGLLDVQDLLKAGLVCFFCLVVFNLYSVVCRAEESTESAPLSQQLQGFNLNGYDNNTGEKAWDINGTKADISDTNIQITNVDANFYGKQPANLTSDHGTINKTNGNVNLKDNVVITSKDRGTQMTTDVLDYIRNKDLVVTQAPVKIVDEQGVITGLGMLAHPNLQKAQINKHVKAIVHSQPQGEPDDQSVVVTSDGPMQMDQVKMYAVFNIHVIGVEKSTGRELHCDKMEIWFDQATKKIKKAICSGHAKAIQGPDISIADKMTYDGQTQVLTMIGQPKIIFVTGGNKSNGLSQSLGGGKKK